ncbi:MAG: VOC family protein [Gemmatimonadetes bacterium]|nr:VOC family protein [Gemmatimonadota bacterium]
MPGLDHIPIAVNDLDAAAARYRQLGFTLKPGRPHDGGFPARCAVASRFFWSALAVPAGGGLLLGTMLLVGVIAVSMGSHRPARVCRTCGSG